MEQGIKKYKELMERHDNVKKIYDDLEKLENKLPNIDSINDEDTITKEMKQEVNFIVFEFLDILLRSKKIISTKDTEIKWIQLKYNFASLCNKNKYGVIRLMSEFDTEILNYIADMYGIIADEMKQLAVESKQLNEELN